VDDKEMTMVERVARSLASYRNGADGAWTFFVPEARAAIAAMREPTKTMLAATEDVAVGYDDFAVGDGTIYLSVPGFYSHAIAAHHAMIDAALATDAKDT
jgi:hypothetical protein